VATTGAPDERTRPPSWRRALTVGALAFVVLLGIGLWPRHVLLTRTDETSAVPQSGDPVGPNGGALVTWSATADCSILAGQIRGETFHRPGGSFLPDGGLCGDQTAGRTTLVIALVLTVSLTLVLIVWSAVAVPASQLVRDDSQS